MSYLKLALFYNNIAFFISDTTFLISLDFIFVPCLYFLFYFLLFLIHLNTEEKQFSKTGKKETLQKMRKKLIQ